MNDPANPAPTVVYFGVESPSNKGHYFFLPRFRSFPRFDPPQFRDEQDRHLDGGFLKAQAVADAPGRAAYRELNGHSIVTWWDRSGDSRGASNSAFIVQGSHSAAEVMRLGGEAFPSVIARQQRAITLPDGTVLWSPPAPAAQAPA